MKQLQDFDMSVIIPVVDNWDDFQNLFPEMAPYCRRNGIEVILVVSPNLSAFVLDYVKAYPFIDWKVLTGDFVSGNRSAAINSAIRLSEKLYVWVWQPETRYVEDVMAELREALGFYEGYYAVGEAMGSWCLMAKREHLMRIGGYDEACAVLHDENLQRRLELAGVCRLSVPLFREYPLRGQWQAYEGIKPEALQSCLLPMKAVANETGDWGSVYTTQVYNWRDCPFGKEQCVDYLSRLKDFELGEESVFDKSYPLIALIPTYNESDRIEDCLRSVEKYCDGIIVLDDDSADDTYQKIYSDKLLLKAKKKRRGFNDRENRNMLLDIAYFFRAEWFIFIDADERFDGRFVDVRDIIKRDDVDVAGVWIANLWDEVNLFRTNMKDSHPLSQNGLWFRWRMFRNRGRMQFCINSRLHFKALPYFNERITFAHTLLVHVGYLNKTCRKRKYDFYQQEDKQKLFFYEDIQVDIVHTEFVSNIVVGMLEVKKWNINKM